MQNWQRLKTDPQLRHALLVREAVVDGVREFFKRAGFMEMDTPLLVAQPGTEPYLEVFETDLKLHPTGEHRGFLTTSPELSMKKLLAAGLGNLFQICKSFRNAEGLSDYHNPEFTILEWYRTNADYTNVMQDCEQLLLFLLQSLREKNLIPTAESSTLLDYQGQTYELAAPWERITVQEAFEQFAHVPEEVLLSDQIIPVARKRGYLSSSEQSWEEAYNTIFLNEVEPQLGKTKPTILYEYPASQAALSQKKVDDQRYAERFEFYLGGLELGNAFTELTDWQEQQERMLADLAERDRLGKTKYELDEEFIKALKQGMPPTGGIAVGVDRLIMLFANAASVRETLAFPIEDIFSLTHE
jgi:elongation factor P--(R)-beta-lysine ligase